MRKGLLKTSAKWRPFENFTKFWRPLQNLNKKLFSMFIFSGWRNIANLFILTCFKYTKEIFKSFCRKCSEKMFFYVWESGAGDRQNRWYDVEKLKVPSSSNTNSFSGVFQGQSKSFELETWKNNVLYFVFLNQ